MCDWLAEHERRLKDEPRSKNLMGKAEGEVNWAQKGFGTPSGRTGILLTLHLLNSYVMCGLFILFMFYFFLYLSCHLC